MTSKDPRFLAGLVALGETRVNLPPLILRSHVGGVSKDVGPRCCVSAFMVRDAPSALLTMRGKG
jgi:hypothetical protein